PVHALVVPAIAFNVAQVQIAQAKPPVALVRREPNQPVGDLRVLGAELGLVAVARFADRKRHAGQAHADAALGNRDFGHLAPARWPHHFFAIASWRISALRRSSAYIFFRRRFSSSNSFRRAIIDVSMPPYLARHL